VTLVPISVGSVEVDIVPNTTGIEQRLRDALVPAATKAGEDAGKAAGEAFGPAMQRAVGNIGLSIGQQIGTEIANRIKDAVKDALKQGITIGGQQAKVAASKQGDDAGGAFARTLRAKLVEAFRAMPKLNVSLADTGVDAELARLRARMETLSNKRIGIDVDVTRADAEVADIEAQLTRLGAAHPNVAVRADTAAARAALADIRAEIERVSSNAVNIQVETDGAWATRLRAAVQRAQASLPDVNIQARVDTTPAELEMARLRASLGALSDERIGVDIDAATAQARIDEIRARLLALGASSPNIAVRADTAAALAQLAAVDAAADGLDGKDINLHVSNREALSAIFQVSIAIAGLIALPAIPVLAAGTGSLVAGFTAAAVGVGAFAAAALPAISDVKGALDAQKQAQNAAATATAKSGQAAAQAASQSLQMAGAQQALASAVRSGAREIEQAREAVGNAIQQAALQQVQADSAVEKAEGDLADAQKAAKQAQLDLVAARKTAADQLQDLNNQLVDADLAQRRAALAVTSAQEQLTADKAAGAKVTAEQLAQDQLAYDAAVQSLSEQQIQTKRLQDQTTAANKAGVKGSATYTQAQDAVAQAQANVTDRTQALSDAQAAQVRTQQQNAQAIADAQAKVSDAEANAADSIASAQRQVASASLSAASGSDASATAAQKYQQALDKLTPSSRATFNAFLDLRTAFKGWSRDLQPEIMPIFTRGIDGAKNSLPGLTPLVTGAAKGIETLQDKVSKGFKSPWWLSLKKDFASSVQPAIVGVGTAIGNVFVGAAGIIDAFLPHINTISTRMDKITGKFANFGKNLKGSPKFENFLDYASQEAPKLADSLGKIGDAFVDVGKATAPLSGPVLKALGAVADVIGSIATNSPGVIQLLYAIFVVTKLATLAQLAWNGAVLVYNAIVVLTTLITDGWTAATLAADAAFAGNPIVAIILIIIVTIGLLIAAVLWAWNHWAWFRDSVKAVWAGIQIAVQAVVTWFTKDFIPFFTKTIPNSFMWLMGWISRNWPLVLGIITGPIGLTVWAITHYWGNIESVFSDGWSWLKKNVLNPIGTFFTKTIPGWAGTLSDKVISAFDSTSVGIAKTWDKIENAAKKPINFVIDTVWNNGILSVWKKVGGWIPGLPKLGKLPLLAQGGPMPMRPGVFSKPTAIVGEGNPRHPEYVIPTDPKYRTRALGLFQQAGAQLLSGGGIFGDITSTISGAAKAAGGAVSNAAGAAWGGIKSAADFLADPVGNLVKILNPVLGKLKPLTSSPWGKAAAALPVAALGGMKKLLTGLGGKAGGGGDAGVHGTGAAAAQAMARNMLKAWGWGGNEMPALIKLWNGESGWNYKALNKSSGAYGIPQSLPASKMAAAGPDWKTSPHTQITWGLDYIHSRYGSPSHAWSQWSDRSPHWYDKGGYLQPGLNLAYNGTGSPEPVFTTDQANALTRLAAGPSAGGFQPGQAVTLVVQDGPTLHAYVAGVADTQVDSALTTVRRTANAQ
jgi:hypothetical protein